MIVLLRIIELPAPYSFLCVLFSFPQYVQVSSGFYWVLMKKIVVELKSGVAMLFSVGTTRTLPICVLHFFFYFLFLSPFPSFQRSVLAFDTGLDYLF